MASMLPSRFVGVLWLAIAAPFVPAQSAPAPTASFVLAQSGPTITLRSSPIPGRPLVLETAPSTLTTTTVGLLVLGSTHTDGTIPVNGAINPFRLDPATAVQLGFGSTNGSPIQVVFPTPAAPALLGVTVDCQTVEVRGNRLEFSPGEVVATFVASIGRHTLVEDVANESGRPISVDDNSFASPLSTAARYEPAALAVFGPRGFVQAYSDSGAFGGHVGIDSLDPGRVSVDGRGRFRVARLPNGRDFTVVHDLRAPEEWLALAIDRASGQITELTGTRRARFPAFRGVEFGPPYGGYWGFDSSGDIAVGVLTYSSSIRPRPTDPEDQIVLVRTDGTTWTATGTATLDTVPLSTNTQFVDQTLVVANERFFVWARDGSLWSGPLDGSQLAAPVTLPRTGTGAANVWTEQRSHRLSADGRTLVLPISGSPNGAGDSDLIAIRNIDRFGFTVTNLSAFPTSTRVDLEFDDARGFDSSMDLGAAGAIVAFRSGLGQAAGPHRLWVAPTDGSRAGQLTAISGFPSNAVWMTTPHVFPNGAVSVFAGPSPYRVDLYVAPPGSPAVLRLTTSADTTVLWSLDVDVPAPGERLIYAARRGSTSNLVALDGSQALTPLSGTGAVPELLLPNDVGDARIRLDRTAGRLFLIARPDSQTGPSSDDRLWSIGLNPLTPILDRTGGGAGPAASVRTILEWGLFSSTDTIVTVEGDGVQAATSSGPRRVVATTTAGIRRQIDRNAPGQRVVPDSLRVGARLPLATWITTLDEGAWLGTAYCLATLDDSTEGWPLFPFVGPTSTFRRLAPLSSDF